MAFTGENQTVGVTAHQHTGTSGDGGQITSLSAQDLKVLLVAL